MGSMGSWDPYVPSLPKFGKNLMDPPPGFLNLWTIYALFSFWWNIGENVKWIFFLIAWC